MIELKKEVEKPTILVNSPLSTIERRSRKKISNHVEEINNAIKQHDLINFYRTLQITTAECIQFKYIKMYNILGQKTNFNKF